MSPIKALTSNFHEVKTCRLPSGKADLLQRLVALNVGANSKLTTGGAA
jgi:hypothetical protein